MFNDIASFLPILSIIVSLCVVIGGYFAFRSGYSRTATEIQEKVIAALQAQNDSQEMQIKAFEKEITRLKRVVATIQLAIKRRGLQIEINGESITIIDSQSRGSRTTTVSMVKIDESVSDAEKEEESV